ncbi:uncharacterized protein PEZ65_013189 [Lycodopsis pacificus]
MSSDFYCRDDLVERGSIPLDIDNVHMLLQVEQEQIQRKTFTNWVNAQLAKRRPPCMVLDLFSDFRDGSRLLDLLEVMSGQRLSRERGRGMFQHRSNIETALSFLKQKSIKLVNINIPDIIDGKPSIILGLIWTIILQYHIEELASSLSFNSRQSSMESLASLDSRSTLSSRSASSSPVPPRGSPLHNRFRVSAKKALLLWVREQCHKAGCSINVKDFKASWRSGVVFLAIQYALRPDLVDLSKARTRSNRQNLEEAFRIAERELRIPRLLDPDDVDVRDPDEKSIMTYVAQFLQYSKDLPVPEEEMQTQYLTLPKSASPVNLPVHYTPAISASPLRQATPARKAQEVTCWLLQAYEELLEGWDSTEGESYSERYHVFQTFLVSFNEQRRPIMPLLTAMRRTSKLSEEQRSLRAAWDSLAEKLREYKVELDTSLPAPLDSVARWLLKTEKALAEEEGDPQDHGRAADDARHKQELLKVCLEEMPQHVKTFQSFQNLDEDGNMMVPADKMDELKRRFTSVRVTAKYHGIKLEYWEQRHTVLELLGQIRTKLRVWKRPYFSPEAVRVLLQEWHVLVNTQELPSLLEAALQKLKQVSEKYSSKSALAADYHHVSQHVKQLDEDTAVVLEDVTKTKSAMGRVLAAWDSYSDGLSSLQAWLEQGSAAHSHGHRPQVPSESLAEWGSRQAHLNEMGNFLMESTDPQTSRSLAEELRRLNTHWAEFVKRNAFVSGAEPSADVQTRSQDLHALIKEATLVLKEPLEAMAGPLRTYRKRIQFTMRKIKEADVEALAPSPECSGDQLEKLKLAVPEVMQTLFEAEQVCIELQHSVSGLDSRLAELLYWETETRELYQLLRAAERQQQHQHQRGQEPRARVLISRGLQLEGQVVTEEQDLQVMVMTSQKNSPIQYLHASAMQDRVRAAVAQSQATVGMLSSLGARRDRSRSPPEGSPPSKVFKQAKEQPQHLRQPTQQPNTTLVESHGPFVPKIVVQEYRDKKVTSPPMPYTYAQAVMGTRTKSPPEGQVQAWIETTVKQQQQTQEQGLVQQQEQLNRQKEKELHQQELKQQQPQPVHQQGSMQTQQQKQEQQQEVVAQQQQVNVLPQSLGESPDLCIKPAPLAQAPPQTYTEAYTKAQALARNGFEEAKHCLQEHILETINVFKDKCMSAEQASVKEETLKTLDPELLEEFLRAAKGMEAFCTPSQLRDMESFTQSVRTQWEACFSAEGSFAQAGQHLEALKELCDTLSPEDAHRLAQTQLRECETRLAAIQRQFSGDQDAPLADSRFPVAFSEDLSTQREPPRPSDKPQVSAEVFPVTMKTVVVERREVDKQTSVEEEVTKKETLERYENCKRSLQAQLAKNDQSIKDVPSDSVSLKGLHTRIQEIQVWRQETESLWSEYANQCSQLSGTTGLEQEKAELQEQWRGQQSKLQRRGSSLGAALRQIDSTENHMVDFTDRLDRYLRQPKDINAFTLANTNILKDIKELDDNIQSELDQLSRLHPESSDLDPRDCLPLSREVETHRASLDQLRQQVRKSEAAARALDRFLMSLRTVDEDISGVQGAPCSDTAVLQDCRSKLALIRQSIGSLKEKAPQLDVLLQGARLTVTRDGVPASCLDMVTTLLGRLEEADGGLAGQQKGLKKETQSKSLGLRKRTLMGELRKLQGTIETQGLKEPTIPAVHHRLRALSDLEGQLQAQHAELQNLRELQEKQGGGEHLLQELETQWKETQRAFFDRKKQSNVLLELLKKFQSLGSQLSNTMQKAEQTIEDQTSYLSKDNLQRSIARVRDIKEGLGGVAEHVEQMKGVCRQLQSQLKMFPACSETPFEAQAHTLMDNWLDVTEKTDAYMDNLQVGLELWEKQLMLGGEVDGWAGAKLSLFAESHPFHNELQVLAMRDEIHVNEENIEHFHKKSGEIQKMLQSPEPPLELQVMETQLRKRMGQVKELFADCTEVFEELVAVKKHLAQKMEECQSAVESIQCSVSKVDASQAKFKDQMQRVCDDLEAQEEQAEAVLKEVGLISSVASPQVLEALSVDCSRLKEAMSRTRDMIHLKREERDKGLLKAIQDERQSFEEWFQDLQLSVNECFESPESRAAVETSLQRLAGFLKSKDPERRLEQLKDQLQRGGQQLPPQQLSEFTDWVTEQQKEVGTFRTHCHSRQQQMEPLLSDLNSLQKQHDSFREWLQNKETLSVESHKVKLLLKDLQDESGRAASLSDLLASVRRQGVRAESLLKDGDNLTQRYRNLESRLQRQADAQSALESESDTFSSQAKSTRTWITGLVGPLASLGGDAQTEQRKHKAQAVLNAKPEGDSKVSELRRQSESLCEQEDLEDSRKQEVKQSLRETEEQWRAALQTAEENLTRAETQVLLDKDLDAIKTQNETVRSWIRDQELNMQSLGGCMQAEEKLQIAQAALSSKPDGDSKLQDLQRQCQSVCDNRGLDESKRREVQEAVRQTEERWGKVLQAAEEGLTGAEAEAAAGTDFDAFKAQSESIQSWIREQRQKLLPLGSHMQFEERLQVTQAVMTSQPEGESKVLQLKARGEGLRERLEESRKRELQQLVEDTEQQWRTLLQAARQAELRTLSDDFDVQSENTQAWIRDRQQQLQSVGSHTPPDERCRTAQTILSSKPDGDCTVNNLRRRGQSLCDHRDVDQGRKVHVQKTTRDTEEQWRTVLLAAKQVEAAAGAEVSQKTERRALERRGFESQQQETSSWLTHLQKQLDSLKSQTRAEDRLQAAQTILRSKGEGDAKLQELSTRGQSLCGHDLEEPSKQEVEQKVRGAEEQWTRVLQDAKQALDQAEKQRALEGQLKDYEAARDDTRAWLQDQQQSLVSLDRQTDPEETISTVQTILSRKPEGDSKLTELRRRSQSLSDQEELEENTRQEARRTVQDSEEQWMAVLQTAESTLKKAEVHYSLSRELEAFRAKAGSTKSWLTKLQQQAKSKGSGTRGSRAQIEDRLNTAQAILSSKSRGEAQVMELNRRAQSLCEQRDLQAHQRAEVEQTLKDTEQQWRTVLQAAEETQRELKGAVERMVSCQYQRGQTEARLSEFQKQTANLPRVFPWPGLGERRQAVEQARTLLDQSTALAPVLSALRTKAAELFEITQDPGWSDPSWAAKEESIPALLKELIEAVAHLEQGMQAERQCTQLVEQHEAAQDWLREHVKCQGAPPEDRRGLHNAVNTLKALLQTVDREQREMKELDSSRDSLLSLCTPGGRDALTLEVSQLHHLCATSEQEVRERLAACEARLEELDGQLARRAQGLKDRAAALQWELRSLDQALGYSEPQNNIAQLQQHWHSLKNCGKSLKDLGVKVNDLHQEVKATPATDDLPSEILTLVKSLSQQHDSLKSRLSEHQETCSANTARCLMDCLHALQEWNYSKPSESISSVQTTLEEGEKLQASLREALSHQSFLTECLMPVLSEKLLSQSSETLRKADTHKASLNQSLKKLDGKSKQKLPDVLPGNQEETKTSVVAPPRKSKRSPEKEHQQKNIPSTEKCTYIEDELSVSAELKIEAKTLKPIVTAVIEDITVAGAEQTRIELTKNKSESPTNPSERFTAQRFNTSEESPFKSIKPDASAEPVGAEQIKPAVEESVLVQKVIEQSAPGVGENTTPVPSRRKSKTLATDTEPSKTKVEPEMVKTIITQGSPRNPIGTAAVEETKRITTIVLDVSEPFTSAPMTTDTKSVTEQAETMVVEQAKLGPTSKESKSTEVSLKIAVAKPAQIKSDADNLMSLQTSALITETDAGQPKSVRKGQESKTSTLSTTSEPVSEFKETKKEPEKGKTSSTAQGISQPAETAVKGESKLTPTKSKSPNLSPEVSNKEKTQTVDKSNSQMSLLRSKEQTEAAVVEEEAKVITTRRKSKSLVVSTVPEPVSAVERTTAVVKKPEKSSSSELAPAPTKTAVLEESEVLPPKQKSTTPDQQAAQMTEEPESQRTAFSFREQKSKSAELTTTLQQIGAHNITTNVEPEDNKKEPDCLKSSSTPQVVTEPTETTVVKEKKLSPTKRRSQGRKLSLEQATKEVAATMQEPESQKPTLSHETFAVEETKVTPTRSKSKGIEVSTVPEPMSPLGRITVVEPKETKQEPENVQGQAKTAVVEQIKLPPPKRKSKSTESPLKLADTEAPQTKIETEDQKSSLSSSGQSKSIVEEEAKRVPTRRKSKNGDLSTTSETVVTHRSPDVEPEQNKKELDGQMSSAPDVVMGQTESTAVGKAELLPTKEKSKGLKLSSELTKTKEEHDSQRPSSTPEVVTATTEVTVVEKGKVSPTKRSSKGIKMSPEFASTDRTKTKEQPDSKKQSSTQELITGTTETTVVAREELSSTKTKLKELKLSPELATTELTKTKGEPHSQKTSLSLEVVTATTEITVVEKGELSPTNGKSKGLKRSPELATVELTRTKEEPDSQRPFSTPEVVKATTEVTVVEKGKLSPTKRKSKGLKPFTEPAFTGLSETKDVPDSQIMDKHPHSELQGPKTQSKEATEEAITQSSSTAPQTQPPLSTEPSDLSDYIAKLSDNTVECQKRYLVLDLPEIGATKTCEIKPDQQEAEGVAISDSTQPNSAAFAVALPHKAETEFSEISSPKQDIIKPSETVSQLRLTQERPKEKKDYDVQGEHYKVSTHDVYDAPKSLDENSVKKIHLEPEVCTIQLDRQTSPDEGENTSFTRTNTMNPLQTSIQSERVPENKDMTAADVKPEKAAVKMTTIKVRESRAECQDNVTERDSAQTACEALPSDFIEISISEQDMVKPSQTETQRGLFKTTKERPKPVKEHGVSEQYSTLLTHGMDNEPRSFEEKSVRMEKLPTDLPTKELAKTKEEPDSQKPSSTPQVVTSPTKITVVVKGELSPIERKSKDLQLSPDMATTELTKTKEEPHSQKPSSTQEVLTATTDTAIVEKGELSPTKTKGLKLSPDLPTKELAKTKEEPDSQKPSSTPQVVTSPTKITVVVKGELSPIERKSKDLQLSPDMATTELTKTKEEPRSQKPSSTQEVLTATTDTAIVEKGELSPTKTKGLKLSPDLPTKELAKTKEEPDSQKPSSTPQVVTSPTKITVVVKGELSPIERKSKDLQLSPDMATTELTKTKEEPHSQKPSSTQEVLTATTDTAIVEKGELSPTKTKGLKLSPDLPTKELAKTKEEPDSQKPSSTPQVVTSPTKITVVVKGELSPIERKSKDLQLSPDMATTELTKTKEEPHSQKPSSTQEVLTATTDTAIVEKGELSPTKTKGLKLSPDLPTKELAKTKEEPDSQKPSSTPQVVTSPTKITVVVKGELSPIERKSKDLQLSPDMATTELTKTKEEPHSQKPSSTQEVLTATTDTAIVEKGELSPTKTKGLKLSPDLPTKELAKTKEEPDSQKPSSTPQVVTSPTKITVVVKGELSPIERKSKDLQLSPDMATTELTKTKEEPHSQKPSSTQEVLTATTDTAIVEKGELSPTKTKGLKLSPDLATKELAKTKEEPDKKVEGSATFPRYGDHRADEDQGRASQSEAVFNSGGADSNN